jgi:aspartyl-tRNA(Asn)/glutamyl-tRNA(Gln) amidotransferase subunit A
VLVTPVLSCPVPPADCEELAVRAAMTLFTFPFNALGWPALAVGPVQVAGRAGEDALVLAAGLALEAAL